MKKLPLQIKKLEGKWYLHLGHKIHILHVEEKGNEVLVITDRRKYPLTTEDEMGNFLDGLIETISPSEEEKLNGKGAVKEKALTVISQETQKSMTLLNDITTILKDNIAKIQDNHEYIKQAAQINKSATQIISIAKLNLEVAKEMRKMKSHEE